MTRTVKHGHRNPYAGIEANRAKEAELRRRVLSARAQAPFDVDELQLPGQRVPSRQLAYVNECCGADQMREVSL